MRTHEKRKPKKVSEARSLKIQPNIKVNRWSNTIVPVIRLSGVWLDRLGFSPSHRVTVITKQKRLIIQLDE